MRVLGRHNSALHKVYGISPEADLPEEGLTVEPGVKEELQGEVISCGLSHDDTSLPEGTLSILTRRRKIFFSVFHYRRKCFNIRKQVTHSLGWEVNIL